jgi:hypothetical protein
MTSANDDKKTNSLSRKSEERDTLKDDFIKDFRKKGMAAIVGLNQGKQTYIVNWAQDMVDYYGSILQDYPAKVKDIAELPCPREDLKIAIKVLLPAYMAKGSDEIVDLLKDRYVRLSAFQAIKREDKEAIKKESIKIDQQSGSTDSPLYPTYQKYMQIIISEQTIFHEDITTFIDDLQMKKKDS